MLTYADEALARQLSQEEGDAEFAAAWHAREQADARAAEERRVVRHLLTLLVQKCKY